MQARDRGHSPWCVCVCVCVCVYVGVTLGGPPYLSTTAGTLEPPGAEEEAYAAVCDAGCLACAIACTATEPHVLYGRGMCDRAVHWLPLTLWDSQEPYTYLLVTVGGEGEGDLGLGQVLCQCPHVGPVKGRAEQHFALINLICLT